MAINIPLCCILGFLFVSFGEADRGCHSKIGNTKCHKQCCGMDDNALHCVDDCDGYECKYDSDCDEGCCSRTVLFSDVCGGCSTFPPFPPSPSPPTKRSASFSGSGTGMWLVYLGLGVVAIMAIVLAYYLMRYYIRRRNLRAVVIVETTRPRTTGVLMIRETETIVKRDPPAFAVANYGQFQPQPGHQVFAMSNMTPPPYYSA